MNYIFLDNSEVSNAKISVNGLGGIIVDVDDYRELSDKFRALKVKFGLQMSTPVKWSPDSNDARYTKFRSLENINDFRRDALKLIASSDVKIICCFINNDLHELRQLKHIKKISKTKYKEFIEHYNRQALEYIAQRSQKELASKKEYGQIIVEFNGDTALNSSLGQFYRKIRTEGSGKPFFQLDLKNLSDGLLFSHDFCFDGLEMADFVISSLATSLKTKRYHYVDLIAPKVRSSGGQTKGYGIVVYPSVSVVADNLIRRVNKSQN